MEEEQLEFRQAKAARYLGISPQRVQQRRDDGSLVGYYHGGVWFISKEELEAFKAKPKRRSGRPRKDD